MEVTVDESFPFHLNNIFETGISMAIRLCGVCVVTPTALLPGMASALVGGFVAQYFVQAQLAVKRELSVATAPILATFSSSVSGLGTSLQSVQLRSSPIAHNHPITASIRAYGFQGLVRQELMNRTDRYTSASRTFNTLDKYEVVFLGHFAPRLNCRRWVGIRVDAIGTVFILAVTSYLVYGAASVTPAKIGFALDMAFGFQRLIFWIIIEINATQGQERVVVFRTIADIIAVECTSCVITCATSYLWSPVRFQPTGTSIDALMDAATHPHSVWSAYRPTSTLRKSAGAPRLVYLLQRGRLAET
jgi:hypothetical protein